MKSQTISVYGLADQRHKDGQLIFYVGISADPHCRFAQHLLFTGKKSNREKSDRILDMRKEGLMPELIIFESDLPFKDGAKREKYWIEHFLAKGMPLANKNKIAYQTEAEIVTIDQEVYISARYAAIQIKVTTRAMNYYFRVLGLERRKIELDRRIYLKMSDFERIKSLKEGAAKRKEGSAA